MGEKVRVLITVKTYPIPSSKYDELVCTAGVLDDGSFIRLYPINFRDLDFNKQYRKYDWVEVDVEPHGRADVRKESFRPVDGSLKVVSSIPVGKDGDWSARGKYALAKKSRSMEELWDQHGADRTSLGVIRPMTVTGLRATPESPEWKPGQLNALKQMRLWEVRQKTRVPPRKLPWKFQYQFTCDDLRCKGHEMMIEDWEVGSLYWRLVDQGRSPEAAVEGVRHKFLAEICAPSRDTHFFVGTLAKHPDTWVIIGVFWPRKAPPHQLELFHGEGRILP